MDSRSDLGTAMDGYGYADTDGAGWPRKSIAV